MDKQIILSEQAPAPIGPYSQAIASKGMVFLSGQIAIHAATGKLITQNIESETRQVMENLKAVLRAASLDFSQVVKSSIFVKDLQDFGKINEVYGSYFKENPPARETVEVARLPKDVHVEISMIAVR